MKKKPRTCQGNKKTGEKCRAAATPGSQYCFFHDPEREQERKEAQSSGGRHGRMKTLPNDTPDTEIGNCTDVVRLISATINQVRRGELDPRVANAVGYLANVLIRAAEQSDIETRLAELEAIVREQRPSSGLTFAEAS